MSPLALWLCIVYYTLKLIDVNTQTLMNVKRAHVISCVSTRKAGSTAPAKLGMSLRQTKELVEVTLIYCNILLLPNVCLQCPNKFCYYGYNWFTFSQILMNASLLLRTTLISVLPQSSAPTLLEGLSACVQKEQKLLEEHVYFQVCTSQSSVLILHCKIDHLIRLSNSALIILVEHYCPLTSCI